MSRNDNDDDGGMMIAMMALVMMLVTVMVVRMMLEGCSGRAPAPCLRRKQAGGSWRHVAIFQVIGKLIQMKIMN